MFATLRFRLNKALPDGDRTIVNDAELRALALSLPEAEELMGLLREAWRLVAPKAVARKS